MPTRAPVHRQRPMAPRHQPREQGRQARRALNTNSVAWKAIRLQVLLRDKYQCRACGRLVVGREAHVDHVDGDDSNNDPANLQTLCQQGHSRKTWAEQNSRQWDGRCRTDRSPPGDG